jgi:hypothetical protein
LNRSDHAAWASAARTRVSSTTASMPQILARTPRQVTQPRRAT